MRRLSLMWKVSAALLLGLLLLPAGHTAELRLHNAYTDNMVLQREKPVTIKGTADAGTEVTVRFAGQEKKATADEDGRWVATLDPMKASATGQALAVSAGKEVSIKNVLIGDVWLVGRQTSADIALGSTPEGEKLAAATSASPTLRVMTLVTEPALEPQAEISSEVAPAWGPLDKQSALALSAPTYHFARALDKEVDVPLGIIDVNMGPYFAIGWMSDKAIADAVLLYPDDGEIDWLPEYMHKQAQERLDGTSQKKLDAYYDALVEKQGERAGAKPSLGLHPMKNPITASVAYNAVIHPLADMALKGVLLQLGNDYPFIPYAALDAAGKGQVRAELNAAWADTYGILKHGYRVTPVTMTAIPVDWRRTLGDERLPIGLIMPPGSDLIFYARHNREMRELQRRMQVQDPGLGLILPGAESAPLSGQPVDEEVLTERSIAWVLGDVYRKDGVVASGPIFERVEADLDTATVYFRAGTAEGLKLPEKTEGLFEVAGPDSEFVAATPTVEGNTIKLTSDETGIITFVRYGWEEKPSGGLVNAAGLPAIPFNSSDAWAFDWIVPPEEPVLPEEYQKTANEWPDRDVAIINGSVSIPAPGADLSRHRSGDSEYLPSWIGPTGILSAPFGRNIIVLGALPDSPGDGKVQARDVIYSVNGKIFGEDAYRDLSAAITHSESEAGEGKLVLGIRREGRLLEETLELAVLGTYSSTTPYYCPKSERIVRRAEEWMESQYRPTDGAPRNEAGFLKSNMLFLLATKTPRVQGLVRREVYDLMDRMDISAPPKTGDRASNWALGHDAMLLGEYYHATGDANVLPYLKHLVDFSVITQLKPVDETPDTVEAAHDEAVVGGWRHKYPTAPDRYKSGYGLLPHAGMGCIMGMYYAQEAGLPVDETAYRRGLKRMEKNRAEYGSVIYSYNGAPRSGPQPINPVVEGKGLLSSQNGKLGMAAALFDMIEHTATADICSRFCVYAFNNTRGGHGGMFFNNFWTPVGAYVSGAPAYKHFMKGQTWWRELYRRHDGSYTQAGRGGIGVAYALHRVAPREGLLMLGAAKSAFGPDAPVYLRPALKAHEERDYAKAETLIQQVMEAQAIPAAELPTVKRFLESVQILQKSIEHDLTYAEAMLKEGKDYLASLEAPQLEGVVAKDNPRLKAILATLATPESKARVAEGMKQAQAAERARRRGRQRPTEITRNWVPLVADRATGEEAARWKVQVIETPAQAPEGWTDADFDDAAWATTTLPISWRQYHTLLLRTHFTVDNKAQFDAVRLRAGLFQQRNVTVYLNGVLVAKIDDIGRGGSPIPFELTDLALQVLKEGENTLTIMTRHNRRWGPLRGEYTTVSHDGATFMLEASEKPQPEADPENELM